MSNTTTATPYWRPAAAQVAIVAKYGRCGKEHVSCDDKAAQDAFRSLRTQPPLHIATTLQLFGFPLLTEAHVERWRNRDGTYGAATAAHDDASLSADKTLRQLGRLANTAARGADPACHAEALLVTERQQQALDSSWPQLRHIDRETAGWNSRLRTDIEGLGRQHWWIRKTDEVYMDGDSELKAAQKERVVNVLLPFLAAWRLASPNHDAKYLVCKDCA
ncbi:hypothetical protein F5B18DRAFT_655543 [Nemania serpens]|nr:hypothetical protein F5B18DRAFT_655543 [Nemania serpens]